MGAEQYWRWGLGPGRPQEQAEKGSKERGRKRPNKKKIEKVGRKDAVLGP